VGRDARLLGRLLGIGLFLTIGLGALLAGLMFPGIAPGVALLIGASLAPTDAALGLPVITNPIVPVRIRRVLAVESGLNDGIATPVVLVAITLATAAESGTSGWIVDALRESGLAVVAGIAVGFGGGWLLGIAERARWTSRTSRQLAFLALAAASYTVSIAIGGNGFIAAFVGGLAFRAANQGRSEEVGSFAETQGILLSIAVWIIFGATLGGELLTPLTDLRPIVYALLSLTLLRMVPVGIALIGTRMQLSTVAFMGWFGPRGLASIVFGLIGIAALEEAGQDVTVLAQTIAWTIMLSVVLHGLSAGPLARWYGRIAGQLPTGSPEGEPMPEPIARPRRDWVRPGGEVAESPIRE